MLEALVAFDTRTAYFRCQHWAPQVQFLRGPTVL